MNFIGREREVTRLLNLFDDTTMRTAIIYGRRRVGKSYLIRYCLKNSQKQNIYFECKQTSEMNNVESIASLVSELLDLPQLSFSSIEDILEYLFKYAITNEFILVLDEYSYLRQIVKGLDSILQSLIDKYRDESKIKLILCGSYVDIMKSLQESANPLYGRIDSVIDLKPMDYYDSSFFYPNFKPEDKVRVYSVFGGIPYYNQMIDDRCSVKDNLVDLFVREGSRLENEVEMFLKTEISKMNNANEVFETLAAGFCKYSDILSQSHVSSGPSMVDALDRLINMNLVAKEVPINDKNSKRKSSYYIKDNLAMFYYRYLFKYKSQRLIMSSEEFYNKYIDKDFEENYVPRRFEHLCKEYLIRQNRLGKLDTTFTDIGKYYYDDPISKTNGEFDVVTLDEKGYIFYEAKFRKKPIRDKEIEEEIAQVRRTGMACYRYGFFSSSGFDVEDKDDLILIDIEDLY